MNKRADPVALPQDGYAFVDALRGIAAMLVLIFHTKHVGGRDDFPQRFWAFFDSGWAGVNMFLLISGFVITLSVLRNFQQDPEGFRRGFLVSRSARIVPLYLLTGAVFLAIASPAWLQGPLAVKAAHLGSHLAFVHNLHPVTHGSINGPNWSIGLEVQFYLLILCIAPWLVRHAGALHLAGALLFAASFRYASTLVVPAGDINLQFFYATQLPGVIDHFALGMALAIVTTRSRGLAVAATTPGWRPCLVSTAASLLLLGLAGHQLARFGYWGNVWMVTFLPVVLSLAFAALLNAAVTFPLAKNAAFAPLRYLGEISYGLYLWHMPVLLFLKLQAPSLRGVALLAAVFAVTLLLSALSWHTFERPLMQFLRRRAARPGLQDSGLVAPRQAL
ncbi:MAG: acyltransferase 3 [Ramlibacter sp.]|jgi:peptidoglycan/LPS O-acetylase OafA/YrhL|nr:acyltransferase 3 [Ramlibacter sp.]